jgi:putative inorganic carbon (HCO3(-)) transporter
VTAELARAGGVIGAAGLAVVIAAPSRFQRLAGLAAWALGCALLAIYLAPKGHTALLAAAAVLGLLLAVGAAALFRSWPWLLALSALACVPARIHVTVGSTEANLLVPLYGVVAAAALLLAWSFLRGSEKRRRGGPELGVATWPLAAFIAWSGLSLLWTDDLRQGSIDLLFFYLPFGLLAVALARLPWRRFWVLALLVELVAMALVFAAVGIYQYENRDIFWNPKLLVANVYAPFYRVNSVFWDPSIYGRFLVVAILACLVVVLFGRDRRVLVGATVAIVASWAGLLFSFSQSSFAALIAGVVLAAVFAWRRGGLALAGVAAAVLIVGALAVPNVRHDLFGNGKNLNSASGGRGTLIREGIRIAVHHPVAGVGIGGFKRAYADLKHLKGKEPKAAASHDTPVTVAAETGVPGLLLFGWLLLAGLALAFRRFARDLPGLAALVFGLVFAAIAVHSLFYNAFFEDPIVWGVLGLAAVAAREPKAPLAVPSSGRAGSARGPVCTDRSTRWGSLRERFLAGRGDERPQPAQLDREVEPEREQDQRVDGAQRERAHERDVERLPERG